MPVYEYICESCHSRLEKLQKVSDPPLLNCDVCQKPALKKLVSLSGFRLSGGGWYETDFKDSDKKKNLVQNEEKPSDATASKSDESAKAMPLDSKPKTNLEKKDSKTESKTENTSSKDSSNAG